jgi:hypothetical protein
MAGGPNFRQRAPVDGYSMTLLLWYVGFMVSGTMLSYLIGRLVEYQWGSNTSLIVFLVLYFVLLWVSWILSVWMTEPKKQAA